MRHRALLLSALMPLAASGSAQSFQPNYAPAVSAASSINWAIADWRRFRQSSPSSFADYARFLIANPGWPGEASLRQAAEAAMRPGEATATVLAFPAPIANSEVTN